MGATAAIPDVLRHFGKLHVLAPHPDDEVFGCAGLILQAQSLGLEVHVHVATDGELCFGALLPEQTVQLRATRRSESMAAAKILGYDKLYFWGLGDGHLSQRQHALRDAIAHHHCPHTLWAAAWEGDGHPDHTAVGTAMLETGYPCLFYPVWALVERPRLQHFQALKQCLTLTLSSHQLERKYKACQMFVSQLQVPAHGRQSIITRETLVHFQSNTERFWYAT